MSKHILTYISFLLLSFSIADCYAQQYQFNHFGPNEGLTQPFIYTINQDDRGFLWIGTGEGLFRYDGFEFRHFTTSDSLAGSFITESLKDQKGNLWFGHMNGKITHYNGRSFSRIESIENQNSVTGITEGENGRIWISSQAEGLYHIGPQMEVHHITIPLRQEYISSLHYLSNNHLFIGTTRGLYLAGLNRGADTLKYLRTVKNLPEGNVTDIIRSPSNGQMIVLAQGQGIFTLSKTGDFEFSARRIDSLQEETLENIQGATIDKKGRIWLSSLGSGVFRLNLRDRSQEILHINNNSGLPSNDVKCLFRDREGNIWFGLYGDGLARFIEEKIVFYSYKERFPKNSFYALDGSNNHIWAGADRNLLHIDPENGDILEKYNTDDGLPDERITALDYRPIEQSVWIGTEKSGVYKLNKIKQTIERIPISSGDLENSINYITGDQNYIWIGTKKGICRLNPENNETYWYNTNNGLPHNNVRHIHTYSGNKILAGTQSNHLISIKSDGQLEEIPVLKTEGLMVVNSITEDQSGNIWICTYGNGVFKLEDDTTRHFQRGKGLLSDYGYSLVYANNKIFVGHHGGVSEIDTKKHTIKTYDNNYGIKSSTEFHINAAYTGSGKEVWFGTSEGVVRLSTEQTAKDTLPPRLKIRNVYINKEKAGKKEDLLLSAGSHELEFEYIGIQLRDPEAVSYQYRLKGYSKGWSEPIKDRSVRFGNVRSGEYTFQVRAYNENGIVTETPVSLDIKVKKYIYQSVWFYVVLIIFVGLLGYGIIIIRERNLKHEKRKLEKKVEARTEALHKANEELELRNEAITSSIEYAKRIQMAILPTKIPFNNTLIFYRPKDIVSGDFYWLSQHNGYHYMAAVDCTGHGVPGAFMSFIGHISLKKIVIEHNIAKPSEILYHLNHEVKDTLNQREDDPVQDGMDIGLARYNPETRELQYAGSFIPLWLIRENELYEYKANRLSLGQSMKEGIRFTNHTIQLKKGDTIYMMSDGYASQFGGWSGKKFKTTNVKDLILSIQGKELKEQKQILASTLDEWTGEEEQIDDIMIIGRTFL